MRKQMKICISAALTLILLLSACGGSGASGSQTGGKAPETTAAQTTAAAETTKAAETTQAETTKAAETVKETEKAAETKAPETQTPETTAAEAAHAPAEKSAPSGTGSSTASDAGKYLIYEYEAGGHKVSHDMLVESGMGDTYLELYPDGTGKMNLFQQIVDLTWKPGVITVFGTSNYIYEIKDGTLYLDMQGVYYTMLPDGAAIPDSAPASGGSPAAESKTETEAAEAATAESAEAAAETSKAAEENAAGQRPDGVPGGDGIVTEEQVQKAYVWLSKVKKDPFSTTYEELRDYFGTDGLFDKEEYSEHMKVNKRYYKWISEDDKTHFLYVNLEEESDGSYELSSYNTSGFSGPDAVTKYQAVLEEEARAADIAAAGSAPMKDFSVELRPVGDKETVVTVKMQVPESGWAYDEQKNHLVENDDINTFGAGFIQFKLEKEVEKFDFNKDKFENYKEIDDREIGGVVMHGRTYKNIGYEWTEYIAQMEEGKAISIGLVRVDAAEGTMADRILKSITFE